jgi:cell division protein FtsQ
MSQEPPQRRRRRKPSAVNRLRPFWFLLSFVLVLGAVAAYFLATWPALYPHAIEVSGNRIVSRAEIVEKARINLQQNLWLQNSHAMAKRIEAIPYVDVAVVHRRPPAALSIAVTERAPFAVVRSDGEAVTIDSRLRALQAGAANGELPQIVAPGLKDAAVGDSFTSSAVASLAHIIERAQTAKLAVDSIGFDKYDDVTIILRSGVHVMLGDATKLDQRLAMIEPILTQVQHGTRRIAAIDLRAITTPVVVYGK